MPPSTALTVRRAPLGRALAAMSPTSSEDCLFINVWKPANAAPGAKLPVMVWIFGGGFVFGSGSSPSNSGVQFAKQGVILITFNYRVGRFGFFAFPALSKEHPEEPKGNYAYMDQIAALKWIQQNIAAFGGDPNNVTIFGFSAGGVSVHSMLASPMARGLFQKAIVESGGSRDSVLTARPMSKDGVDPNYPVSAETIGIKFAQSMGIEGTDQAALAKLRALSAEQVVGGARCPSRAAAFSPMRRRRSSTASWSRRRPRLPTRPTMSRVFRSCSEATAPILQATGSERRPRSSCGLVSASGAPRQRRPTIPTERESGNAGIGGKRRFRPSRTGPLRSECVRGQRLARLSLPVLLRSDCMRQMLRAGTPHGGEIAFVFGTLGAGGFGPPPPPATDEDRAVSQMAQGYWVNFAKTGNPNGAGLPTWPRYDPGKDLIFEFHPDGTAGAIPDPWKPRLDVMQKATESGKRADF